MDKFERNATKTLRMNQDKSNRTINFDVSWHGFQYELNEEILFKFQMKMHFHFGFTLLGIFGNFICIWVLRSLLKYKFNWQVKRFLISLEFANKRK